MTAPKMTRKRALELAQQGVMALMSEAYKDMSEANTRTYFTSDDARDAAKQAKQAWYAELAAALQVIEHMARQGEMHL